jgi:thioesterase domain-containing protein
MAQQLAKQGKEVAFVGMFDSYHPDYLELLPPIPRFIALLPFVLRHTLPRFCLKLIQSGPDVILKTLSQRREKTKQIKQDATKRAYSATQSQPIEPAKTSVKTTLQQKLNNLTLFILQSSPWAYLTEQFVLIDAAGSSLESGLKKVRAANQSALQNYQPQDFPGKITILRASIQPPGFVFHPYLGWDKIQTKEIETHEIQGFHEQISRSPELAEKLQQCLDSLNIEH